LAAKRRPSERGGMMATEGKREFRKAAVRDLGPLIRQVVDEAIGGTGLALSRLYLFGSLARGPADAESDWDILVVVRGGLERGRQRELFVRISQRLAEKRIPADIIIRSEAQFEKAKLRRYSIERIVDQEGVRL